MKRFQTVVIGLALALVLAGCSEDDEVPADSHGDTPGTATVVTIGSSTAGYIQDSSDEDWFRLNLGSMTTFTVFTTGGTDTVGALFDSALTLLTSSDDIDFPDNLNFSVGCVSCPADTYYVGVTGFGGTTGAYTLEVQ